MISKDISIAINRSLNWLYTNIYYFDPINLKCSEKQAHKMFSELQFLLSELSITLSTWDLRTQHLIHKFQTFSRNIIFSPTYYEQLQRYPAYFRMYGMATMYFLSYWKDEDTYLLQEVVKKTYNIAFNISPETPPFRLMEILYCIHRNNYYLNDKKFDFSLIDNHAKKSILNSQYDLANYTVYDEYAITHAIFYLTNMGERKINTSDYCNLESCLTILACKNMYAKDLDLLGEFVIDICCCNLQTNFILQKLLDFIVSNQQADGVFPAPLRGSLQDNEYSKEKEINEKQYFIRNYHTTIVCIMALSVYSRTFLSNQQGK